MYVFSGYDHYIEKNNNNNNNSFVKMIYNPGHNILELYNILVQIKFSTNKRKLDI